MKKFFKRFGCLTIVILWLVVAIIPLIALSLAKNSEVQIGPVQLFLVNDDDVNGMGFRWKGSAETPSDNPVTTCNRHRLTYIMWRGEGQPATFCTCDDGVERQPERRQCVIQP